MVTFIDVPEAITQGEDVEDALKEASDCLEEALANRIVMGLPITKPSHCQAAAPFIGRHVGRGVILMEKSHVPNGLTCPIG